MKDIIYKAKSILFRYSDEARKCKRHNYNELIKYIDFKKTYKNKLIICFGAGRSGQNWFSKIFNSHSNWVGSSERFADYEAFYRYVTYYNLPVQKDNFFKLLELSAKRDMAIYNNSFITSPYLSFGVKEIIEKLYPDTIFFNIRNPIKTIESFHKKGWYLHLDKELKINSPMFDITTDQYRSFSRIIPKNEFIDEWKTLSRIGKIAWYWCIANKAIFDDFNKINNIKKYLIKLEDVDQNYNNYQKISEIFNFKEILVKKKFLNIINKASNKGSVDKHLYKDWNDKEKKDYHYIIEKFFSHYDSLKTNL